VLFPNRAAKELVVRVAWSTPLAGATGRGAGEPAAFRVGSLFGYVDPNGALLRVEPVFYDVTLNDAYYANYAKAADSITVRRWDGSIAATLHGSVWPLIPQASTDAILFFSADLTMLGEASTEGAVRWRRDLGSLITCVAYSPLGPTRVLAGTVDGTLHLLDSGGEETQGLAGEGSRVAGVYGCAASPDGRWVAAVLGLGPQRLVVWAAGDSGYRPAWSRILDRDLATERTLRYTADSRHLLVDADGGAYVFDARGRSYTLAGRGYLESVEQVGAEAVLGLRDGAGRTEILLLVPPDIVAARAVVAPADVGPEPRHLSGGADHFLYGAKGRITRLEVLRL
jgi:hypothetical protein